MLQDIPLPRQVARIHGTPTPFAGDSTRIVFQIRLKRRGSRRSRHFPTAARWQISETPATLVPANFASSGFGNSGFGGSGFSNSFLGSGVSLFPNLLFGGLLHLGTSVLGGGILEGGLLAASAISSVAHLLGSGLGSNGYGQSDSSNVDFGYSPGGFGIGFGFAPTPAWPACNPVASFQGPGWGWSGYCGPSPYYPSGWNGSSQYGDRRTDYSTAGGHFGNSDFHSDQN